MVSFPNVYTHRKVAEAASKRCEICFKPSTSVLVTPDKEVRLIISSRDSVSSIRSCISSCPSPLLLLQSMAL